MISLIESILSSTNSGKWANLLEFDMIPIDFPDDTKKQNEIVSKVCSFYNIKNRESKIDIQEALKELNFLKVGYKIQLVLDKDVFERLKRALDKNKCRLEHSVDYVPTIYKTQIPLIVKSTDEYNNSYLWVWHWESKYNLFNNTNRWLLIYTK